LRPTRIRDKTMRTFLKLRILFVGVALNIVILLAACTNQSSSNHLTSKELAFCEDFFIVYQLNARLDLNEGFRDIFYNVLNAVRAKGVTDIKHAYTLKWEWGNDTYNKKAKQIIEELDVKASGIYKDWVEYAIRHLFADDVAKWNMPELKTTFIEKLDNGTQIWQIQDFTTMRQARLKKSEDGGISIGNVEGFSVSQ